MLKTNLQNVQRLILSQIEHNLCLVLVLFLMLLRKRNIQLHSYIFRALHNFFPRKVFLKCTYEIIVVAPSRHISVPRKRVLVTRAHKVTQFIEN
jgi:hypothetical protein